MVETSEKNAASIEWLDRSLEIEAQRENFRYPVMIDFGTSHQSKHTAFK